jgi:hypothetical protein
MSNLAVFASEYDGNGVRVTEDGRFSVFDVLVAFVRPKQGRSINPRQILESIRSQYPEVVQIMDKFKFPGKGQRETPVANEEGIYQILMLCPGKRGAEFRKWASQIIRERREEESNPELAYNRGRERAIKAWKRQGKTDSEIQRQLKSIEIRNNYTDILQQHGITIGWQYAAITNIPYETLTGFTAKQLKAQMGLSKSDRLKDHISDSLQLGQMLIESRSGEVIERDKLHGFSQCRDATQRIADKVKAVFED